MITSHTVLSDRADDIRANWLASQLQSLESNDFLEDFLLGGQHPAKVYGKRVYWHDQGVDLRHLELTVPRRCGIRYLYWGHRVDAKVASVTDLQVFLSARLCRWAHINTPWVPFATLVTINSPRGVQHALVLTQNPLAPRDFEVYDAY